MVIPYECALWLESSKKNFFARFARSKFFFAQINKNDSLFVVACYVSGNYAVFPGNVGVGR